MLNIKIKEPGFHLPTMDIDGEFYSYEIKDSPVNRILLQEIEQATYCDEMSFIDRFGYKLPKEFMSTGCKAALLVANTDIEVDLAECGPNAKGAIIQHVKSGKAIMPSVTSYIPYDEDICKPIEVQLDGYRFTDMGRLNRYIVDELREDPDMDDPGIEKL